MITYQLIGSNPIITSAACDETSAIITWTVRTINDDQCGNIIYYDELFHESVSIRGFDTTTGSITRAFPNGETYTIDYTIQQPSQAECHPPTPGCDEECLGITAYAEPYYIEDGYAGDINILYEYTTSCVGRKTGVKTIDISDLDEAGDGYIYRLEVGGCETDVLLAKKKKEECEAEERTDISISFSEKKVPATGATINVIVGYKKTIVDEDCVKHTIGSSFSMPWAIECTSGSSDDKSSPDYKYRCCKDHYVTSAITVDDIRSKAGLDIDDDIYYNGMLVTESAITYSVIQKAKYTDECSGFCEDKTTYCVDSGSVKVQYETSYLSDIWNDDDGTQFLPFTGGRIKVKWNYSAHTISCNGGEYDSNGEWDEIIVIGGCDERPIDCKDEYQFDPETYTDCEICDSECCYNFDGNGTCRCVILFKEQTPDCTTCPSETVYDELEERGITYNMIRYRFRQDCHKDCESVTTYEYGKQSVSANCDFTGVTSATVPYTATTEYIGGFGCPESTTTAGTTGVTYEITRQNTSHSNLVLLDDEMWTVIQLSGETCAKESYCDCESLVLKPGGNCTPEQYVYTYGIATTTCEEKRDFSVQLPYTATCDGFVVDSGSKPVKIDYVSCNDGYSREFAIEGGGILKQDGGCSCDGGCSDGIVEDTTLNTYISNIINNSILPTSISTGETPCTYKYLKSVYDYATGKTSDSIQISWVLANAMSEVTPYSEYATSYFVNAASSYGNNKLDPVNKSDIYEKRTSGAIHYVMYKYSSGQASDDLAANARKELHNIVGVSATLRSKTEEQWRTDPEYVKLAELIPSEPPSNVKSTTGDYKITQDYIQGNPTGDTQAIADKDESNEYLLSSSTLNLGSSYESLLDYTCNNFTRQANGAVKWDEDYERWRPGAQQKLYNESEKFNLYGGKVYIDDNAADYYSYASCCGACGGGCPDNDCRDIPTERCQNEGCGCSSEPCTNYKAGDNPYNPTATSCSDDCASATGDKYPCQGMNSHQSYPSGHSMKAYFAFLVCTQAAGISNKEGRIYDYCYNRVKVRAHWNSDVVVGRYNASIQIGFMNGFQQYKDEIYKNR